MPAFTDFNIDSLAELLAAEGYRPDHARTILSLFYGQVGRIDLDAMSIPKPLRALLRERIAERRSQIVLRNASRDGTVKLLVGLQSGGAVESVLMPTVVRSERAAGCVSSQIGCAMGCDFCASTKNG